MNRERLQQVRDRIAAEPPERLNMEDVISIPDAAFENDSGVYDRTSKEVIQLCGTAACIAGWACVELSPDGHWSVTSAARLLELDFEQQEALFAPPGYDISGHYTKNDALAALDSLIHAESDDALPVWPSKAETA